MNQSGHSAWSQCRNIDSPVNGDWSIVEYWSMEYSVKFSNTNFLFYEFAIIFLYNKYCIGH